MTPPESGRRGLRITIVSQYFAPEAVAIPLDLARELRRRGHSVRVLTGYPNYPEGRLYAGYRQRLVRVDDVEGFRVRRVPLIVSHSRNPIARMANYLSFALSSLTAGRFVSGSDVIYVYATQMTAAFGPSIWSRTRRIPFVLHVQDLWPESITGSSMVKGGLANSLIARLLRPWLSSVYRRAAAVIGTAPSMTRMLIERGVAPGKVETVLNWREADEQASRRRPVGAGVRVVYSGNLGELQDLETVVAAAALVDIPGFSVTFVGAGTREPTLKRLAAELGADSVSFRGRVDRATMNEVYAESDFQLVTLKDLDIFRGTIPSKFQAAIAHGVPVITTVVGDVSDIVTAHHLGFTARPGDPAALAAAFRAAAMLPEPKRKAMGERARRYYSDEMSIAHGVDRIEAILVGSTARKGSR